MNKHIFNVSSMAWCGQDSNSIQREGTLSFLLMALKCINIITRNRKCQKKNQKNLHTKLRRLCFIAAYKISIWTEDTIEGLKPTITFPTRQGPCPDFVLDLQLKIQLIANKVKFLVSGIIIK